MRQELVAKCRAVIAEAGRRESRLSSIHPSLFPKDYLRAEPLEWSPSHSEYPFPSPAPIEKLVADLISSNEKLRQEVLELENTCEKMMKEWQAILQPYHQWAMSLARERMERTERRKTQIVSKPVTLPTGQSIDFSDI